MDKIILVNKEKGYTSRDVVNVISKVLGTKKVGHFGTLDPLATGLLVIGVGVYTKIGNLLESDIKEYEAEVLIGKSTDTFDITGNILQEEDVSLDKDRLIEVLNSFKKTYEQEVPIYSAVKVNGKKLYEYAREGKRVSLPKKSVTVHDIKFLDMYDNEGNKYFRFKCLVSKGTYIRSLINDISKEINIPLCMSNLIRTRQDKFLLKDAYTIDMIKSNNYKSLDIKDVIDCYVMDIPSSLEKKVLNGSMIDIINNNKYILFTLNGEYVSLYKVFNDKMKPVLIFKK